MTFVGEDAQIAPAFGLGDLTLAFQGVLLDSVASPPTCSRRHSLRVQPGEPDRELDAQQIQDILNIIVAAATPLLLAAIGEVVAERAGVLNLGLEGMMIVGASTGFAFAYMTDSTIVGVIAGVLGGVLMAGVFAFLTIGLATNQVAAGLALTIFGRGLANLIGGGFVGLKRAGAPHLYIPEPDLPLVGRLDFRRRTFSGSISPSC